MRYKKRNLLRIAVLLATTHALAATWYVNGTTGSDGNNCMSPSTPCATIGHAISAASAGDSIMIAPATYTENVSIGFSLAITGSGSATTIIAGSAEGSGGIGVNITSASAQVTLSRVSVEDSYFRGVVNSGTLIINNSTIYDNGGVATEEGGGVYNTGTLTMNQSTVSDNRVEYFCISILHKCAPWVDSGGGIQNDGTMTINESTIRKNKAASIGGGIDNAGIMTITNSTIAGNSSTDDGGGIYNAGTLLINSSTVSGNIAKVGAGVDSQGSSVSLQNSIVANSIVGGNCSGSLISNGYNLSSDNSCNFTGIGDLNNTDPMLGPLQNNGGPTLTMALPAGSPAVTGGNPNPSGCTDGNGHILTTDQRGDPRYVSGVCDMGAYELQSD